MGKRPWESDKDHEDSTKFVATDMFSYRKGSVKELRKTEEGALLTEVCLDLVLVS